MAKKPKAKKEAEEPVEAQGRPSKFNDSIREKIIELATKGKTIDQIAEVIGVTPRTLYNWQGRHQSLFQALKEAKQVADELVEASLFARAVGFSHPEEKVFQCEGQIITHDTIKQYPPDTTAAIFWLKNRRPAEWREKQPGEQDQINISIGNKSDEDLDVRISELMAKAKPSK